MSGDSMCVIGARPHPATDGHLCRGHLERMAAMLREVENEACHLNPRPSMAISMDSGHGGLASERSPARLDVLVHTDHRRGTGKSETDDDANAAGDTLPILDVLHSWARIVREERDLATPDHITISGERDLLSRHLAWVAAQPWVDEAFSDVRLLLSQLLVANERQPDRPYSHCPVLVDGQSCHGKVWIHDELQFVWRLLPDRCAKQWEQAPGAAVCDTCAAAWRTDAEKARLRRLIDDAASELSRPRTEDGRPMLTADEIAADRGWKRGTVFVRAHREGIPSVHGHYDPELFRDKACA